MSLNTIYSQHKKKILFGGTVVVLWMLSSVALNRPIMDAENPARYAMGPSDGECVYVQYFTFGKLLPTWEHIITVRPTRSENGMCGVAFDREFGRHDRLEVAQHVQPVEAIQPVQAQSNSPQHDPEQALLAEAKAAITNTRYGTIPIPLGYLKQFGIKSRPKEKAKVLDTADDGSVTFLLADSGSDPDSCGAGGCSGIQVWQQVGAKYEILLEDMAETVGMLSTSTGGHRDLVLQSKHMLNIYRFNGATYKPTQCFEDEDMAGTYVPETCLPISTGQ
jgi:hypothetical protein